MQDTDGHVIAVHCVASVSYDCIYLRSAHCNCMTKLEGNATPFPTARTDSIIDDRHY
jgi:hypothetical protein